VAREREDNEIRARLAANDSSALDMIWDLYASDLLGYLVSIHCSRHDAEDTLQDVFVTIAKKRTSVARARKLKPYLFRLSRNAALNRMKRNKRIGLQEREAWEGLMLSGKGESLTDREQQVGAALAILPEKQRAILVLKFYRDKTLREIGDLLGISANTAGSRYRYGMAKLRDLLREIPT
jgi:RNA polymerase sigma-70 factor (ECF subfamily)